MERHPKLTIAQKPTVYISGTRRTEKVLGGLWMNYLMYGLIPILILTPLFSYFMATKYKEARGYPHTTITNMSRFYPQDIVFRFFMLPAGGFINLIYMVLFAWMKKAQKDTGYTGNTGHWLLPLGHMSVIGYLLAIGTIDAGPLPFIHITGALEFFLTLFSITISQSLTLMDMHSWCSSVIRTCSLRIKMGIAIYLLFIFVYALVGALREYEVPANDDDKYMVIFEWNLIMGCLVWLSTFVKDWQGIYITLKVDEEECCW